jgi:uncharacterized protein YdaU (DUF1376 family)
MPAPALRSGQGAHPTTDVEGVRLNYYEHHLGDYAEATGHLSFVEDAAYSRLIRKYYATEKPLPADIKATQRLIGARTKEEREAVETVLHEFFDLREDGWHQTRCDAEIEAYQAGEPEREERRQNKDTRLKRHRAVRAALFDALRTVGVQAAWNVKTPELRQIAERNGIDVKRVSAAATDTAPDTRPDTAPETPATATQTPDTRHQYPEEEKEHAPPPAAPHTALRELGDPADVGHQPTPAGRICRALKAAGVGNVNPGHPTLAVLLQAGATEAEFLGAVAKAKTKRDPFAYVLSTVQGQRQDAAEAAAGVHHGPLPHATDRKSRQLATAGLMTGAVRPTAPPTTEPETVDVPSRLIAP